MQSLTSRALVFLGFVALAGCGGGSSGTQPVPYSTYCGNDAAYALGRYTGSSVEIVVSGNNNQIAGSYQSFNLYLSTSPNDPHANYVTTSGLAAVSDTSGPHPFPSDYYYSGTIQGGLIPGAVYYVWVNAYTSNCQPIGPIGSFQA